MRVSPRAKWLVQYSAGTISNRTVIKHEKGSPECDKLDEYAKVMWNWLYRGATRSKETPDGLVLFPDVVAEDVPFWRRLLTGRGR
jgi:hypothetical protein